jgi:ectoine hydroxylase-related dioxygenase (phytanoyl-CoA dioxygenase family)
MEHKLTEDQKNFYDENGYVILEKVFTDSEAEKFNRFIRRHANTSFAALINPDRYDSLLEQDERPKSDITLKEIQETSEMARSIMTDKRMLNLLNFFHEKKTVGLSSQFIFKEAYSDYCSQAWKPHQDNFYPKSKNSAYITLNWFLRDADRDNGTIYCYPGSHKLGLLPANNSVSFREKIGENPGSECEIPKKFINKKIDIIIPGNSIVVLNGNCIHGSYPNNSNRSRPWFSSCYITENEEFIVGNSSKREKIYFEKIN